MPEVEQQVVQHRVLRAETGACPAADWELLENTQVAPLQQSGVLALVRPALLHQGSAVGTLPVEVRGVRHDPEPRVFALVEVQDREISVLEVRLDRSARTGGRAAPAVRAGRRPRPPAGGCTRASSFRSTSCVPRLNLRCSGWLSEMAPVASFSTQTWVRVFVQVGVTPLAVDEAAHARQVVLAEHIVGIREADPRALGVLEAGIPRSGHPLVRLLHQPRPHLGGLDPRLNQRSRGVGRAVVDEDQLIVLVRLRAE